MNDNSNDSENLIAEAEASISLLKERQERLQAKQVVLKHKKETRLYHARAKLCAKILSDTGNFDKYSLTSILQRASEKYGIKL